MAPLTVESILAMGRGFMDARILLSGAELGVFTLLSKEPLRAPEVAGRLGLDIRAAAILVDALTALGLLRKEDGQYCCPEEAARYLSADSPHTVIPMLLHSAGMWRRWSRLTDIAKGITEDNAPLMFDEPGQLAAFIGAMHVIGGRLARELAAGLGALPCKRLLDIGGATGTYAEAFLEANPHMHATIFDRPAVIDMARKRLAASPLLSRFDFSEGDFYEDELPQGYDLALLSAIIHQNSPAQNLALYEKCARALISGGRILIRDHVMNPDRTQPVAGALFAVNMLVGTPGGNTYTFEEIKSDLMAAGFTDIRLIRSGDRMDGLVEGIRP